MSRKGDQAAYRLLLEGLGALLKLFLMGTMNPRMRSKEQVEDLVQDVLISIHKKRDLYSDELPFLPWVFAIARYRLIDSLRMEKRRPECVEWIEKFDSVSVTEMPSFSEEEEGTALLAGLSPERQEILRLAKVDEIPLAEIAAKKGMSLSAVKVSVHRSLKILRKKLVKGSINHGD